MLDKPPKERPADAASGHGHSHCAGCAPVDPHDGRRDVPSRAQSRGSFQPIAGNHFNEIVAPPLATADADADDFVFPGQTDGDHHVLAQGSDVGFVPLRRGRGGRPARRHEKYRKRRAKYSPAPLAPLLRCHRLSARKTRSQPRRRPAAWVFSPQHTRVAPAGGLTLECPGGSQFRAAQIVAYALSLSLTAAGAGYSRAGARAVSMGHDLPAPMKARNLL